MKVRVSACVSFIWIGEVEDSDETEDALKRKLEAAGFEDAEIDQIAIQELDE